MTGDREKYWVLIGKGAGWGPPAVRRAWWEIEREALPGYSVHAVRSAGRQTSSRKYLIWPPGRTPDTLMGGLSHLGLERREVKKMGRLRRAGDQKYCPMGSPNSDSATTDRGYGAFEDKDEHPILKGYYIVGDNSELFKVQTFKLRVSDARNVGMLSEVAHGIGKRF
ncbi:hypothetical protein C8R44DRAFT_751131 [Mycena epipterygia]|nr:hypothetical protein C8R44DRAFT_751131 [Mycena epipterygia]